MKQPKIILFDDIGKHGITGYLGYSYANIYYEMIFQLARKNEMNMNKVTKLLKKLNFHNVIQRFLKTILDFLNVKQKDI